MKKFIKITSINSTNVEGDTEMYINIDDILSVYVATQIDKRQRNEVKAIVVDRRGGGIATSMSAAEIVDLIEQASV